MSDGRRLERTRVAVVAKMNFPSLENFRTPDTSGGDGRVGDCEEVNGNFEDSTSASYNKQFLLSREEDGKILFRDELPGKKFGNSPKQVDFKRLVPKLLRMTAVVLIGLNAAYLGGWIQLLIIFTTTLPKSFGWEALRFPFGAVGIRKNLYLSEEGQLQRVVGAATGGELEFQSEISTTPPYVIVLGIGLTSVGIALNTMFLGWKGGRRAILFYVKQLTLLDALFSIFGATIGGSLLYRNALTLKGRMRTALVEYEMSLEHVGRWRRCQSSLECCGVVNYTDWAGSIPLSCCKSFPSNCSISGKGFSGMGGNEHLLNDIWRDGCLDKEQGNVSYYGGLVVLMTGTMFFTGLMQYWVGKEMLKFEGRWKKGRGKSNQRVFIRQGNRYFGRKDYDWVYYGMMVQLVLNSLFVAFGGVGEKNQIIRKNDVMIDTHGALASTLGIDDHHISLEIKDFSFKDDHVTVHREMDRICVFVHDKRVGWRWSEKSAKIRGKATITSINDSNLDNVVITPSSNGLVTIFV